MGGENAIGPAMLGEAGTALVGVATSAETVAVAVAHAGGELSTAFTGVSNTCGGAGCPVPDKHTLDLDGVAKIILRAAPEEKDLVFGAFEGVSAILECARPRRPDALRCPVAGIMECG